MNFKSGKETSLEWPKSVNSRKIRNSQLAPSLVLPFIDLGGNLYSGIRTDICWHSLQWMIFANLAGSPIPVGSWLHRWLRLFLNSWLSQPPPGKSFMRRVLATLFHLPMSDLMKVNFESCSFKNYLVLMLSINSFSLLIKVAPWIFLNLNSSSKVSFIVATFILASCDM